MVFDARVRTCAGPANQLCANCRVSGRLKCGESQRDKCWCGSNGVYKGRLSANTLACKYRCMIVAVSCVAHVHLHPLRIFCHASFILCCSRFHPSRFGSCRFYVSHTLLCGLRDDSEERWLHGGTPAPHRRQFSTSSSEQAALRRRDCSGQVRIAMRVLGLVSV